MEKVKKTLRSIYMIAALRDARGASMAEYVIILALVAIVAIAAWIALGTAVSSKVNQAATSIQAS